MQADGRAWAPLAGRLANSSWSSKFKGFRLDSGEVNGSDAELGEGSRSAAEADGPAESNVTACNIAYGTRRLRCYDCSISGPDAAATCAAVSRLASNMQAQAAAPPWRKLALSTFKLSTGAPASE